MTRELVNESAREALVEARNEVEATTRALQDEQAAREDADRERARLHRIFREAPAMICVTRGPDHIIEMLNRRFEDSLGSRYVVGLPIREAFQESSVGDLFFDLMDEVYATGEPYIGYQARSMRDDDGDGFPEAEVYSDFVIQPIYDRGGVEGVLLHAVDVTAQVLARRDMQRHAAEMARSEEALKRSLASLQKITIALERNNRELDQFAYVASHDLKAPLRGIANLSQWIEEEIGPSISDQAKEYLALLRGRIHRMEGLIEGILSYSRAGRAKHGAEDVDVKALVDELIELASPPEGAEIEIRDPMPILHTERLPLQQVFLNLITNGLKYAGGEAACLTISAREAGAFYQFSVADNGPGIAPEFHEKIWGIFQTLNPRDKVEGTGIGLALVRKIVENKGGRAWVESEAGAGATFHFLWPRSEDIES